MKTKLESLDVLRIFTSDKKKDGTPIIDFSGKPARKISIKTTQYPDKWLYSYPTSKPDDPLLTICERTVIQAIVWENNGFMNFKLPTRLDLLEDRVRELEEAVFEPESSIKGKGEPEFTEEELTGADLPF